MDKKTMIIAGSAFLVGGLTVGALGSMHERYGENNPGPMMHRGSNSDGRQSEENDTDALQHSNAMGNNDMGMGSNHSLNMMVSTERQFLQGMIPHHEEAVAAAKEIIARGGSTPEIRTLAENIISAQEKEIIDMKTWFKTWYGVDYTPNGKYQLMMRPVTGLSGVALDKVFLADMIQHHMGAIMMANSVTPQIEHAEITTLAGNIKTTQSAEITQMQRLLKALQ